MWPAQANIMDSNKQEDTVSHQSHGYNFLLTAVFGKGL